MSTWQEGEGAWEGHWFTLNSGGELKVFPDAESTEEQMAVQINLKEVERVERSKGVDFYEFCIDLVGNDTTTRMRPIDRGDMQARCAARSAEIGRDRPRCTA